ncbi:HesB/YadR/YfhF family protein [Listeria ilorinensis]|uniref:HesB/YadR/YfhF family protein n=1 Tax=Listeria ilorinensis TaxID=2867439 RepID=UPI001EF5338E|nr:HesB/YadR/YfhF family protein [Listeria ilorinensis]
MKINVTENAQKWFKDEFDVSGDNGIRLFAKYGGSNSSLHPGFSIGLAAEAPTEIAVSDKEENLLIFVEEHDYWYFKEHDWKIDYDPDTEEVKFSYSEPVK